MIKNVIFDLGRVMYTYWPREDLLNLGFEDVKTDQLMGCIFNNPIWREIDKGLCSFKEGIDKMCVASPMHAQDIRRVLDDNWIDRVVNLMPASVEFFKEVKQMGYKTYVISDMGADVFAHLRRRDAFFFDQMDGILISAHEKLLKPDPAIFECLLNRYELVPEETVFIDDLPGNIAAAKGLGLSGIVFVDVEGCRREFELLGCN